ncbi:hypothetical protein GCM10010103_28150 [Streptomyces paradoxus]
MGSGVAGLFVPGPGSGFGIGFGFGRGGGQGASPPPGSGHRPGPVSSAGCLLPALWWDVVDAAGFECALVLRELRMGRECSFGGRAVGPERRALQVDGHCTH